MASLEEVFTSFCALGQEDEIALMDNGKFAKFFRDLKLLDKKVTATDVDIIFNTVKSKTERKINFKQFQDALKLVAEKKYPEHEEAVLKLEDKILHNKTRYD